MRQNNDEKFMRLAIAKAKQGIKDGQAPFGACVVKNGKVISCAHNLVWKNYNITAHAEITAIEEACDELNTVDLSGCVIYSTCEPCPMCFSACHWAKISKIFYGACIEDAIKAGFSELTISNKKMKILGKSKIKIEGDFLRNENLELFKIWSKQKSKKIY